MFSNLMSYFTGRPDPKQAARDAICLLRQQLVLLTKKEDQLAKKVEEELKKAKANSVSNKKVALDALKKKKAFETELDHVQASQLQLEMQIQLLESANLNAETLAAMKQASEVIKLIHGKMPIGKAESIMLDIHEATNAAEEMSTLFATNLPTDDFDEVLKSELADLEQEVLDEQFREARSVPTEQRPIVVRADEDEDEDDGAQIRQLQLEMAM